VENGHLHLTEEYVTTVQDTVIADYLSNAVSFSQRSKAYFFVTLAMISLILSAVITLNLTY